MDENKSRNMFWTGGWDSTFRLLQLLLIEQVSVKPYYLIDADRKSTGVELQTMRNIRNKLFAKYPHTQKLLRPTIYADVNDIPANIDITESWKILREKYHIGTQYDWMSRFIFSSGIEEMEVCGEKGVGRPGFAISAFLIETGNDASSRRVDPQYHDQPEYAVFGRYRLPVLHLTKTDMLYIAREHNFLDILEMSWFCHDPDHNHRPCGKCRPCQIAMQEGMAWRIPWQGKVRYYLNRTTQQLKPGKHLYYSVKDYLRQLIKRDKRLYSFLRLLKHKGA